MSGTQLVVLLTYFVLAVFVGFEVISKVPTILHTPLMSGSNAIHGIILVGALFIAAGAHDVVSIVLGFLAVLLATTNVVGGFVVTDRMLEMFRGRGQGRRGGGAGGRELSGGGPGEAGGGGTRAGEARGGRNRTDEAGGGRTRAGGAGGGSNRADEAGGGGNRADGAGGGGNRADGAGGGPK